MCPCNNVAMDLTENGQGYYKPVIELDPALSQYDKER